MADDQFIVAAAAAAVHARDHRHPPEAACPGHDIEVVSFGPTNAKWFCHCHGLESELMPYTQAHAAAREHHGHGHEHEPGPTPDGRNRRSADGSLGLRTRPLGT